MDSTCEDAGLDDRSQRFRPLLSIVSKGVRVPHRSFGPGESVPSSVLEKGRVSSTISPAFYTRYSSQGDTIKSPNKTYLK